MEMGNNSTKWIVYHVVCTENKKCYIGVHKTDNPNEFDGYIGNGYKTSYTIKNPKNAYTRALKKYGYDKFIRTTLKVFDNEQDAYEFEALLVDKDFVKRRDTYNTALGGNHPTICKKFYQYDYSGNLIKEWNSRNDVLNFYKCDSNRIHRAVENKWDAFNSYWTTEYHKKLNVSEYRKSKFTSIYQFDINGELINIFENAKLAANENQCSVNSINEAVSKKRKLKNFFFTKTPELIQDIIKSDMDNIYTDKTISLYDSNFNLVQTFKSIKELSKFLNVTSNTIKSALKNHTMVNNYLIAKGFNKTYDSNDSKGLQIDQFDLNGKYIKTWNTIAECAKEHPKVRLVLKGIRNHTHGYTFKIRS